MKKKSLIKNLHELYVRKKLSLMKIENLTGISSTTVKHQLIDKGIPLHNVGKMINDFNIDYFTKSLIVGMLLGDSSLSKSGKNRILTTEHSYEQKDYLAFKSSLIRELGGSCSQRERFDKRTNKTYKSCTSISNAHVWLNNLYMEMYPKGKKTVSKKILNYLTPQAICLWYLDDGHLRNDYKSKYISIATNCLSNNEIGLIINYFKENYNLEFKKWNHNQIGMCGKENIKKFMELFGIYIPECMKYKYFGEYKNRTFCCGDIHGRYEALREVLKKCMFDYNNSKMILLGDICDGGYNTYEVVEELLKIKNLVFVLGNHDEFWLNHITTGWVAPIWTEQGGWATINSYAKYKGNVPKSHQEFFDKAILYHIEDDMLFVHGGFDIKKGLKNTSKDILLWDRELIQYAYTKGAIEGFKKVFVGHTATQMITGEAKPARFNNLIMMDCGAGWDGRLAIMDIDTEKYWLSRQIKHEE